MERLFQLHDRVSYNGLDGKITGIWPSKRYGVEVTFKDHLGKEVIGYFSWSGSSEYRLDDEKLQRRDR